MSCLSPSGICIFASTRSGATAYLMPSSQTRRDHGRFVALLTVPFLWQYRGDVHYNDLLEVADHYESKQGINVIELFDLDKLFCRSKIDEHRLILACHLQNIVKRTRAFSIPQNIVNA